MIFADCLSSGKPLLGAALLIVFSISLPAAAQEIALPEFSVPKAPAAALSQIPTDPKAAAELADFLAKNVPAAPLPAGSANLDVLRSRAADLRKQQAAYLESVASGTVAPFAELTAARPQHERDLAALAESLSASSSEKDPVKRESLSKALFAALQPLGPFLESANYVEGYENVLSPEQAAELDRLEAEWEAAAVNHPPETPPLIPVSPGQLYTLTHLSVPLVARSRPDSTILFRAQSGGLFSNKLPIIEVKTDANGLATAFWSTKGDAIADCPVDIRSPSAPTDGASFNITVVKPVLQPLPGLPLPR